MKRLLLLLLPFAALSCTDMAVGNMTYLRFEIAGAGEYNETRSILPENEIENKRTDLTVAVYDGGGTLFDVQYHRSEVKRLSLELPSGNTYKVYALANMGDMRSAFPQSESGVKNMEYVFPSYDDVAERGIPMCGQAAIELNGAGHKIELVRLFAKVKVNILHTALEDAVQGAAQVINMCNNSLFIRQANRRLKPFAEGKSRAEYGSDIMKVSDYNSNLNDKLAYQGHIPISGLGYGPGCFQDTTLVFYVPENVQGRLLPNNRDPYGKVHENIGNINGKSYGDICTYLEFNATKIHTQGYSGSVMYRYYLGADNTSDFSVERNKFYSMTLNFTEGGFYEDGWKVTRGPDWDDTRSLYFLRDSYEIAAGQTADVMVHFRKDSYGGMPSELLPGKWRLVVDEAEMNRLGLYYEFDETTLATGENGVRDFLIRFHAGSGAVAGSSLQLRVETADGFIKDYATVRIIQDVPEEEFTYEWETSRPEYVCQSGTFTVKGYASSDLPLQATVTGGSNVTCTKVDNDTFRISAMDSGNVSVNVSGNDGRKTFQIGLAIDDPVLAVVGTRVELNPDGEPAVVGYEYRTREGTALDGIDYELFPSLLSPRLSAPVYFGLEVSDEALEFYVKQLYDSGVVIEHGFSYVMSLSPAYRNGSSAVSVTAKVTDPFESFGAMRSYGDVHDYTLFALNGADPALAAEFADEIKSNSSHTYGIPDVNADDTYVTAELVQRGLSDFTYANGNYSVQRNASSDTAVLTQLSADSDIRHSAGVHDMMLRVHNRHSSEYIEKSCGTVNVYVHTAVGAEAEFKKQVCGYSVGGKTFAEVYNSLAGRTVYGNINSSDDIHFMDVTMKWLTPISGVKVFAMLNARSTAYGALSFLQPVKPDGRTDSNGLVHSILSNKDERISICGEKGYDRGGVGLNLYRALLPAAYSRELDDSEKLKLFFGYVSAYTGAGLSYSPAYSLYDEYNNPASSNNPFYFTTPNFKGEKDSSGRGFHVIHFLEDILPKTGGWINLL